MDENLKNKIISLKVYLVRFLRPENILVIVGLLWTINSNINQKEITVNIVNDKIKLRAAGVKKEILKPKKRKRQPLNCIELKNCEKRVIDNK